MKFRRLIISIFSFLFLISSFHAQAADGMDPHSLKGRSLSDYVYNELTSRGISARQMALCRTQEDNFPYNISIRIKSTEGFEIHKERQYSTIVFIFNQEDIIDQFSFLEPFILWGQEQNFDFNINIILTACDKSQITGNDKMTGTEIYAEIIQGTESYCVLYSNLDAKKITTLTPGSGKQVCPLWLVDITNSSFEKNGINPQIKGSFYLSLYKLDILRSSRILSSFLTRDIPAVEMNIKKDQLKENQLINIYQDFLKAFSERTNFQNDTHYIPVDLFGNHFWITENITITMLLILITLSLVFICDLGFIFRKGHSMRTLRTKRAIKTLYLVPITIIILTVCLQLAQFPARLLYNNILRNPIAVLGIKVILSFTLISLFFLLELKFHKNVGSYTYEYLLRLSSLLNVFIFSAIDISLFYLFAVIYIIITISLHIKNSIALYIFFLLSLIPYFQLIFAISTHSTMTQILPLIFANPLYNLILSCAITPLSIILLRIYSRLIHKNKNASKKTKKLSVSENNTNENLPSVQDNQNSPNENNIAELQKKLKKRFPRYYALILILTVGIFIGLIFGATKLIQKTFKNKVEFGTFSGRVIDAPQSQFLSASYSDSNYYGGTIRQIKINTNKPATRVEVFVSGESENPIYYTTYTFTPSGKKNQIQFDFPDYPPEKFTVTYTPDNSAISIVDIYAYYDSDYYPEGFIENNTGSRRKIFVKEKSSLLISASSTGLK